MQEMIVKSVDLMGDTVMAAKDRNNLIWVGVNSFCQGLNMEKKQRDWQVEKIKQDKTLSKGCRLLPAGVFDVTSICVAIRFYSYMVSKNNHYKENGERPPRTCRQTFRVST